MDVLIVGAGMSGLMAARVLSRRGFSTRLIERSESVGGRMATLQIGGDGLADLGAQFFTVRSDALRTVVDDWLAKSWVGVWGFGWSDGSTKRTANDGHPRYLAHGGMTALAQRLAEQLDIVLAAHVSRLAVHDGGWRIRDRAGATHESRCLLLTAPAPQSLELLSKSGITLNEADFNELSRIRFGPCLCGIHEIDGNVHLPEPGALQDFQSDIYWVADNQAKGISSSPIVTSHANAKFSRQNWDAPEADVIRELESAVAPFLAPGASIRATHLKKWRFSVPLTTHPQDCFVARDLPPLVFAGDAFGGRGRVEGAFLSGLAAGEKLADMLQNA